MTAFHRLVRFSFAAALAAVASGIAWTGAAEGSCAPPDPLPQRIARADAVVFGRVASFEGGPIPNRRALMVEVIRIYKGNAAGLIFVSAGPLGEGGGVPGQVVATSVDYQAERGSDHTFYLRQHAPAGFSTDACSGSHPGDLDAEERTVLGEGRVADRTPGGLPSATGADRAIGAALLLVALGVTYVAARAILSGPA